MDYSNREYYVVWIQDITLSNAVPVLLHKSRAITERVAFKYSSLDQAYGILHEFWKAPDTEIKRPSDEKLISIYTKIVQEDYEDTLEESLHEISAQARDDFGKLCSLNLLISSYQIFPHISNVRKDLYADILNIFGSNLKLQLTDEEINRSLRVIEDLHEEFSDVHKSKEHAIEIGKVVVFALSSRKSIPKATLYIEKLISRYNLSVEEKTTFNQILNQPNIQAIGYQLPKFDISSIINADIFPDDEKSSDKIETHNTNSNPFSGIKITPDRPPDEDDLKRIENRDKALIKWIDGEKKYKKALWYVWGISLFISFSLSIWVLIGMRENPLEWNLGHFAYYYLVFLFLATVIIGVIPAVLCQWILKPAGKPPLF
jgi:hypothetical protein